MNRLRILFIALFIITVVFIAISQSPPGEDFRSGNRTWNGTSTLAKMSGAAEIHLLSELPSQPEGTIFIIVAYSSFDTAERGDINDYVLGGGTLILMDDYGYGNEVLEALGVDYRFSDFSLLDPLVNYRNERFPKIISFEDLALTSGIDSIVFDHAACLIDVPVDQIIARSSSFSFLDINGNFLYDYPSESDERRGPRPVIANTDLGEGTIIVISDSSIIINGMIGLDDNYKLIENIINLATSSSDVYLDQSHIPVSNLLTVKDQINKVRGVVADPVILFGMAGSLLLLTFKPLWRKRR